MESKYMTLEEYAATLKVGDEVTIEYYSISGDRQTKEKILKITKSGTMTKEELMNALMGLPDETQVYKINDYADLDHSDGCPLLGVIVVNEPDSKPVIYLR